MHGKTKGFFEDTGIILVLAGSIYGGYYLYTKFASDIPNLLNTEKTFQKETLTSLTQVKENNISIEKKELVFNNIVQKDETKEKSDVNKSTSKPVIVTVPLVHKKQEVEVKKEKNVDLVMLRKFMRNIKFSMASHIVKRDDINATQTQALKIRVTVLKDGSYENLVFVAGDKKLFEMNKENILKVFPVHIDDKIKDDFPRYVRISIK